MESGKRFFWLANEAKKNGYKTGAEIGVMKGRTSQYLLTRVPGLHLLAVDAWEHVPLEDGNPSEYEHINFKESFNLFKKRVAVGADRIIVLKGISWEMAEVIKDESLDFIFIDAGHDYDSVIKDLKAWVPKVKPGGLVSGHDIHFPGVLKAVSELIPDYEKTGIDHCWKAKKEQVIL